MRHELTTEEKEEEKKKKKYLYITSFLYMAGMAPKIRNCLKYLFLLEANKFKFMKRNEDGVGKV